MSKEKQNSGCCENCYSHIEEMAQTMVNANNKEVADALSLFFVRLAETLYNADYRKQSEGEWVKVAAYSDGVLNTVKCSRCGTYQPVGCWDYTPFCSHCGAKMKGGAE